MKKTYFLLCLFVALGINVQLSAQTDPGLTNLTHQWTFDDGTAKDYVGGCDGTLMGNATISSKALNTLSGGYLTLPAATIAVNTYTDLTQEMWFTSGIGANGGYTMLAFFGKTTGTMGYNYVTMSAARGDNVSRTCISNGTYNSEIGVNGTEYDDGKLHQMVSVVTGTEVKLYIDGILIGTVANTIPLSIVDASLAYLCKGGYTSDPNWVGSIHKYSMYNRELTADEVLYLFQKGAESTPVITTTVNSLAFDEHYDAEIFSVSSSNLTTDIKITAPTGITVSPTLIPANSKDISVTAFLSGSGAIDGNIVLTSGSTSVSIPIKTASDAACYTKLYEDVQNIVIDPGVNNLSSFAGWGSRETVTIVTNPSLVYCGAASMKVGNGTGTNSGSLDYTLTGKLTPNTTYRVKAMVKTVDGTFQLGLFGYDSSKGDLNNVINTNGEWMPLDFYFTTGATLGKTQGMFWNNSGSCTGMTGYIDNWEMYIAPDPIISASAKSVAFDPEYLSSTFTATASNLVDPITIIAPAGITVSPTSLPADAANATVTVTYDGTTPVNGNIVLTSGTATKNIVVKAIQTSNKTCFDALYPSKVNLIPDPYGNDQSKFAGWGAKEFISIADEPDSVYCGSHTARIFGGGSVDVKLANIIKKNTPYIARIMAKTYGGQFQLGVGGINVNGATSDVDSLFDTQGVWKNVILEFTTGDSLRVNDQPLFVNNYKLTGTRCYIDNWELYEKDVTAVENVKDQFTSIYVQNGKIVAQFDADNASQAQLAVYGIRGELIFNERFLPTAGHNSKVINAILPSGIYIVRLNQNGHSSYKKLIK